MKTILSSISIIVIISLIGTFFITGCTDMDHEDMDIGEKRALFISLKEDIQHDMKDHHMYRCCLDKPCTYCIEKTPGHGEGAECDCISDLVNGVHPCGECIGEILEGHGNKYLAEYFATAIAEKVGEDHLETIQQIISEKYDISVEDQV